MAKTILRRRSLPLRPHSVQRRSLAAGENPMTSRAQTRLAWRPIFAFLLGWLLWPALATAQSLCVFDIAGTKGPLYSEMSEFALEARRWGVTLTPRAYIDERVASEDFKAGQCDAVLVSGMRARAFNAFTGSIDSIGGLPDYTTLQQLLLTLTRTDAATLMVSGPYEVAGVLPMGAAYLFLRDRRIDGVEKMAGRKIAVLEHDAAQVRMASRIGAQAVTADVSTFAGLFNNGQVDVTAAPAVAYLPLELYRGVGSKGAVIRMPVAQLTLQLLIRREQFPEGFAARARAHFPARYPALFDAIRSAENDIFFFFPPPDGELPKYREMLRQARVSMTADGIYDARMMRLMKRVRCRAEPSAAECSDSLE
ncbi:MAG: DUF6091 family protein [Moraxellaceae bacterium]|nr:DUF6091 family protein [Moraxellaceae bacterium]